MADEKKDELDELGEQVRAIARVICAAGADAARAAKPQNFLGFAVVVFIDHEGCDVTEAALVCSSKCPSGRRAVMCDLASATLDIAAKLYASGRAPAERHTVTDPEARN